MKGGNKNMIDTGLMGKGIGIAFLGIGAGIAFDSLRGLQQTTKKTRCKKNQCFQPMFKPPKFKF